MRIRTIVVAFTLVAAACAGSDDNTASSTAAPSASAPATNNSSHEPDTTDSDIDADQTATTSPAPAATQPLETPEPDPALLANGSCDALDTTACLLPWPNDRFTQPGADTPTGLRLDLPADGTPVNIDGVAISVTEFNRADGFAPASLPRIVIPSLDFVASGLADQTNIGASLESDSPLVLLDLDTGERAAAWAEPHPGISDPARRLLTVQPAQALTEGHRYGVILRNLIDDDGDPIAQFETLHDRLAAPDLYTQSLIDGLASADIAADDVVAAWTFTVASTDSITGRLRSMWAETQTELDGGAPPFQVDSSVQEGAAIVVRGAFEMPKYLTGDGGPGSVFNNDDNVEGIPHAEGTMQAPFVCTLPIDADGAPVVIYGHGLLGSRDSVLGIGATGAAVGIGFCALDWIGMSGADVGEVVGALSDLSAFRTQPDRLQQGHLGFLLLGRLLADPDGFASSPEFQAADGTAALAAERISFLGASQGGILGGVPSALTTDWEKTVLAVGGLGYNLLLERSIDWDEFSVAFGAAYPDVLDQVLALEMIELLWQRGENAGWAQHLTADPLDGATPKTVLLLEAFGDHQVANVSTEKLARTLGIGRRAPTLADGRSPDVKPFFGIAPIDSLPHAGSGLVVWDFGNPAPPVGNTPPRDGEDPHGKLSDVAAALILLATFIEPDGAIIDVCDGLACASD